jgi:hypothetical protein
MAQEAFCGLTRNRSIEAYNKNQQHTDPGGAPLGLALRLRAVDPTFTMLRIDRVTATGTEPLGAFTNFAIHSNVLRPRTARYSGDVHAAAERVLEWRIQQHYRVQLVQQMADTTTQAVVPSSWKFRPGLRVSYFPHKTPRQIDPEAMQVEVFASQIPPRVQFQWQDGTPGSVPSDRSLVRLEIQNGNHNWVAYRRDGIPVDDQGLDIDLHYRGETEFAGVGVWQATWYPQTPLPAGRLRFAISARDAWPALYSVPFTLTSP